MKKVLVAGKFDPIHEGHVDHIKKASQVGDYLIIVTHTDDIVARYSEKGKCCVRLWARIMLLGGLLKIIPVNGKVVVAEPLDRDGTVTNTLIKEKPDIFAKGGDRKSGNMPESEIEVCRAHGIQIIYGIGDLLNSSSKIVGL